MPRIADNLSSSSGDAAVIFDDERGILRPFPLAELPGSRAPPALDARAPAHVLSRDFLVGNRRRSSRHSSHRSRLRTAVAPPQPTRVETGRCGCNKNVPATRPHARRTSGHSNCSSHARSASAVNAPSASFVAVDGAPRGDVSPEPCHDGVTYHVGSVELVHDRVARDHRGAQAFESRECRRFPRSDPLR